MKTPNRRSNTTSKEIPQEVLNLFAGGISGMSAKTVVAPIDRIKILYQCTPVKFRLRNVPSVAHTIVKQEGFNALWRGNTATMLRVFPYAGIQFMTFDYTKQYFLNLRYAPNDISRRDVGITPFENLVAGMCAGATSVLCTYPLDLTRAQLAVLVQEKKRGDGHMPKRHSIRSVFLSNFHERGLAGLFRGIAPTMIGIMPYSGIAFTVNEQSKNKIRSTKKRDPTTIEKVQCGALSGLLAQSLTYPLEVTRRRMQTHGLISSTISDQLLEPSIKHTHAGTTSSQNITMAKIMKQLYKEAGFAGFFKGVTMNWMKGPMAFSISFTTYDLIKGWFNSEENGQLPPILAKMITQVVRNEESS